jgi:hypothetical protein
MSRGLIMMGGVVMVRNGLVWGKGWLFLEAKGWYNCNSLKYGT